MILLRPLLLLSTQSNLRNGSDASDLWGAVTLDRELASHACNLCVKTTQELVENLCQNLDTPYRISPWHTVYCIHSKPDRFYPPLQILILNSVVRGCHRSHSSTKMPSYRSCGKGRGNRPFSGSMHYHPSVL